MTSAVRLASTATAGAAALPSGPPAPDFRALGASARSARKSGLLVVLDIHGVLVERVRRSEPARIRAARAFSPPWRTDYRNEHWLRPHVARFLRLLLARHDVGVWSSAQAHTVDSFLRAARDATGVAVREQSRFVWDRSRCRADRERGGWATTKPLADLWGSAEARGFGEKNTLMLDDSRDKFRATPRNGLCVPGMRAEDGEGDETLLWVLLYVEYRREVGLLREDVMPFEAFLEQGMLEAARKGVGGDALATVFLDERAEEGPERGLEKGLEKGLEEKMRLEEEDKDVDAVVERLERMFQTGGKREEAAVLEAVAGETGVDELT